MLNKNPHVSSLQFLSLKPTILNSEFIGAAFILKFLRARLACYKNIQIRIIKKKMAEWLFAQNYQEHQRCNLPFASQSCMGDQRSGFREENQ